MEPSCRVIDPLGLVLSLAPIRCPDEEAPITPRETSRQNSSMKEETGLLEAKLNQMSEENRRLTQTLNALCMNYDELRKQLINLTSNSSPNSSINTPRKRKSDSLEPIIYDDSPDVSNQGTNVSKICVRTDPCDRSLVLKDGYQWKKYGQKVTRDNPFPRAYYKCSFAPTCPVKKKVQRSAEDDSLLIASYEGEHNHSQSTATTTTTTTSQLDAPISSSCLNQCGLVSTNNSEHVVTFQLIAEQLASSLTKDPSFTSAIATAISSRLHNHRTNS